MTTLSDAKGEARTASRFEEYVATARLKDLGALRPPITVKPETSVEEIVKLFAEHRTGSVLVGDDRNPLAGIFSERDLLRRLLSRRADLAAPVSEFMTPEPRTATLDETLAGAIRLMYEGGFRHLPVVKDGRPVAVISARTLIRHITEVYPVDLFNLPPRLDQVYDAADGA